MRIDLKDLAPEQRQFLDGAQSAGDLVLRVVALLSELRGAVVAEWTIEEPARVQLELRDSAGGTLFGHGSTHAEAALAAFRTCWREVRYLPSLPPASAQEAELVRAGKNIDALKAYMRRNGVGLRDAREKLWL